MCDKEMNLKPSRISRVKHNFCSTECHDRHRHEVAYKEMSDKVGEDFKKWLNQKYIDELKPASEISKLLYGTANCKSSVVRWLNKLGIEVRHGSDAVKTQWINNDERREENKQRIYETMLVPKVRNKIKKTQKTKEYRQKARNSKLGEKNPMYGVRGEKSPRWNNNLTDYERVVGRKTIKDTIWREKVYEKDNYTCVACGDNRGGNLNAHHLYSHNRYIDKRYDVNNGVTLCEACHKAFHDKYGYGDNAKEQFDEFINSVI